MSTTLGLTSEQAQRRLKKDGYNEIVPSHFESRIDEIKQILLDPMGLMLLVLAFLQGLIGDRTDAFILLGAYIPVTAVDVILEVRAQRSLRAMRKNLSTTSHVIRDGKVIQIPIRNIVVGDVLVFDEGQSLPADGKVIEESFLAVNESALTGESLPVEKKMGNLFFAGTVILKGRGLGVVDKTGKQTQFGKIARLLEETESQLSPLQKKVNVLVRKVIIAAVILAILLFGLEMLRGHDLFESLIIAMTFGMSAVPEEFPLVFSLYLSMGAWRLSKHGVLIRTLPSVESLGNVDVICTDKTGTLTEGLFQLEQLYNSSQSTPEKLWQAALMACEPQVVDSIEMAIYEQGQAFNGQLTDWQLTSDYPFENQGKHMSHVWTHEKTNQKKMAMKGSVEGVLEHCQISAAAKENLLKTVNEFASQGQRILGLASREGVFTGLREQDERNLNFLGLLLFSDPVRESAKKAISTCQQSGIQIKMLTGDHPLTAHAVADKTGIIHSNEDLYTGQQLSEMTAKDRIKAYQSGAIFSRVLPEQKHEMVQVLKNAGKIVAMTGDGINDAPALKLADIGISMGVSATDVARSTAKIILVGNDFNGIVEAIFEGRRILANLRRSFSYLIAFHIPVVLLALLPPLFGWGELFLPIHIVLLELMVHPISAFAFENLQNPREIQDKSILPLRRVVRSSVLGLLLTLIALVIFRSREVVGDLIGARSLAMLAFFIGNIFFVLVEIGFVINRRVVLTLFSLMFVGLAIFGIAPLSRLLHIGF